MPDSRDTTPDDTGATDVIPAQTEAGDEDPSRGLTLEQLRTRPSPRAIALAVGIAVIVLAGAIVAIRALSGDGDETTRLEVAVRDDFDRPDADRLGQTPDGVSWQVEDGQWGIEDGEVVLLEPNPGGPRTLATVDLGSADGAAEVRLTRLRQGAGIVFRYQGPFNYWYLVASPDFATWNLRRVVDGTDEQVGDIGLAAVDDGTVVRVELDGPSIEIFVDGRLARALTDTTLQRATGAGIIVFGESATDARWDDFRGESRGDARSPGEPLPPPPDPATTVAG